MQKIHQRFLEAMGTAMKNEQVAWDDLSSQDWDELFHLAEVHHVLPMILDAVYACPAISSADPALLEQVRARSRMRVLQQANTTEEFLKVYAALRQAGATPMVVKGIICRSLYPKPDCRRSGDEDVLIPSKEYWLCKRTLAQYDVFPTSELEEDYEVPFRKKDGFLYIELHKSLFPASSTAYGDLNTLFTGVIDRAVEVQIRGQSILTLSFTDHMLYLICHAFKHFLHSGFGIRQVCDMTLYANAYGSSIDWQAVLDGCKAVRAERFAAALFRIGEKYLNFQPEQAAYPECWRRIQVDEGPLLEELVQAGIYGQADKSRLHSGNITLSALAAQKQGKRARSGLVASLFPPAKSLHSRYPYLVKYPWLLPVAWASRIAQYGSRRRDEDNSHTADILRIGNHRVNLMRHYGIIE